MRNRPNRSAFTLIELLVTVAIIGILASILFPRMNQAKARARLVHCQNNIRQTLLAAHMYSDDNVSMVSSQWNRELSPYIFQDRQVIEISPSHIWHCPGDEAFAETFRIRGYYEGPSYEINGMGTGASQDAYQPLGIYGNQAVPIRPSEIFAPSEMIIFGDAYGSDVKNQIKRYRGAGAIGVNKIFTTIQEDWLRHLTHGKLNMGYADGHVIAHNHKQLLLEKSPAAWRRWNRDNQPHFDAMPQY